MLVRDRDVFTKGKYWSKSCRTSMVPVGGWCIKHLRLPSVDGEVVVDVIGDSSNRVVLRSDFDKALG